MNEEDKKKLFADIDNWLQKQKVKQKIEIASKEPITNYKLYPGERPVFFFETEEIDHFGDAQPYIDLALKLNLNPLNTLWLAYSPPQAPIEVQPGLVIQRKPARYWSGLFERDETNEDSFLWGWFDIPQKVAEVLINRCESNQEIE